MNAVCLFIVLLLTLAAAQATTRAAQQPAQPRRDVGRQPPRPIATGSITGRVTAAGSSAPVRRAQVIAMNPETMDPRTVLTDDEGRFELRGLEPGAWQLTASKAGYATQRFGQRRHFDPVEPLTVSAAGERFTADFALTRSGVITGRVYDEYGEPLAAVRVHVMRSRMIQRRRYLQRIGEGDLTDDTGTFRLYGLPPGEYYVSASLRVAPADSFVQTTYAPTYYPGTGDFAEAQRVFLDAGAEVNVDFPLLPFRTARVSGVVVTSAGSPANAFLNLASEAGELGVTPGVGGATRDDGTFTLPDVPPGAYTLNVALRGEGSLGSEVAAVPLTVYGDDIAGLTLVTFRPGTMRGTVVADTGVTRRLPTAMDIVARSARAGGDSTFTELERNAFLLTAPAGPFHLNVEPPDGWMVKAILVNEADATDTVIDLRGEQGVPVRVVLSDRVTEVSGSIVSSRLTRPASVVVFADDAAKWTPPSRYVRTVSADDRGVFRVLGLPTAARYRAVAVDALEDGEGDDPDFLARMRDRAVSFTLADGEKLVLDLPLVQR